LRYLCKDLTWLFVPFIGVAAILGLVGWIGYSIATTAPPPPPEPEVELGGKEGDTTSGKAASPTPTPQQSKKAAGKNGPKRDAHEEH